MLHEITSGQRKVDDLTRRWFSDDSMDLFVFLDQEEQLVQLQLCYDKLNDEHVLSWKKESGFSHDRIDDGQNVSGKARAPIMVANGICDVDIVLNQFKESGQEISSELFNVIYSKLIEFKQGFE